jgi:aldehyde:ferredoxin oxidoreductase
LIDDFEFLDKASLICNNYGVDFISVGDLIAFAMECYDRGLITKHDTEGIDLTWGNKDACMQILQKIVDAEGFGKILGQGFRRAADLIGGSAEQYAMHVKGVGISAHDPRRSNAWALQNATCNRGADHADGYTVLYSPRLYITDQRHGAGQGYSLTSLSERARKAANDHFAVEGMGEYVAYAQNVGALLDSLTLCMYAGYPTGWLREPDNPYIGDYPSHWAEWLLGVAGWQVDAEELLRTGERIFNLRRLINVRRGVTRKDDTLPKRLLTQSRGAGPAANNIPPVNVMLDEYYICRGWSPEGIPTKEKLTELGIS